MHVSLVVKLPTLGSLQLAMVCWGPTRARRLEIFRGRVGRISFGSVFFSSSSTLVVVTGGPLTLALMFCPTTRCSPSLTAQRG